MASGRRASGQRRSQGHVRRRLPFPFRRGDRTRLPSALTLQAQTNSAPGGPGLFSRKASGRPHDPVIIRGIAVHGVCPHHLVPFRGVAHVAYIPGAPMMEVSSVDPKQGGMFYSIEQERVRKPKFTRNEDCMQCHGAQRTLGVPGHFVRSVPTDAMGELDTPNEISDITHSTPLADRWAGWYVTGQHGPQTHRGNLIGADAFARAKDEPNHLGNLAELGKFFDESKYLARGSDIVALMVLEHQAHMHNYITRLNFETQIMTAMYGHTRYLRHQENAFLRYLLFTEEAPLTAPLAGNPEFVAAFTKSGPRDSKGRSLRDLDLQTRMFKYPCSFLIYSDAFAQMAPVMKEQLLRRLFAILTGTEAHSDFANIPPGDRQAILEILRETMPSLPDYWQEAATRASP